MITCAECGAKVGELEVFPGRRCLACHAKHFDADNAGKTAEQKARELREAFGIQRKGKQ